MRTDIYNTFSLLLISSLLPLLSPFLFLSSPASPLPPIHRKSINPASTLSILSVQRRANRYCRDESLLYQFGLKQHSDWLRAALIYLLPRGDSISVYHTDMMSCQKQVRETTGVVVRVCSVSGLMICVCISFSI